MGDYGKMIGYALMAYGIGGFAAGVVVGAVGSWVVRSLL